jgi:Fe-S-cluster containining protein
MPDDVFDTMSGTDARCRFSDQYRQTTGDAVPAHPQGFACQQCGACCRGYVPVSEEDLLRWAATYRDDILRHVSAREAFIRPLMEDGEPRCPFLRRLPRGDAYACRIHDTKPEACARFPETREDAARVGCPGVARASKEG